MKRKILIIDDEVDFCMIMKGYFQRLNYEVLLAYTLREGLALFQEQRPEILFLDNNLPDGNGWDCINEIVENSPQVMAYLVSAHRNISPLKDPRDNVIVWEKPISMEMLKKIF
ncbi:MAG TPA: response regulator [Chitinophagaceae bacterium]|nr:response regulator [Chitinophagaceae bacterium]